MASTLSSLWMNTANAIETPVATPATTRGFASPIKTIDQSSGLTLDLRKVLGNTVLTTNGFDCLPEGSCFATCAGSTAVLYNIDENLVITQRYFRAKPNGSPSALNEAAVQQATPEHRGRPSSSIRVSNFGTRGPASPAADFASSPGKGSARQRTRAATCLSLSVDGRLLAVGETGYVPRILLFSTRSGTFSNSPYSTLSEHAFGVRCLSFSPDSRWLCSVGDIHDGFIFLWAINARTGMPKLYASNKCTSFVQELAWMGSSIVTVGVRHVKLWRTDSLGPSSPSKSKFRADLVDLVPSSPSGARTLPGRNCLLGSSLESTFTCVAAISECKAIICTDKGDIFLLDDSGTSPSLSRVKQLSYALRCVTVDMAACVAWVGGHYGEICKFSFAELEMPNSMPKLTRTLSIASNSDINPDGQSPVALGQTAGRLIMVDADHCINISNNQVTDDSISHENYVKKLYSHSSPVLGIDIHSGACSGQDRMTTWDSTGKVIFWSLQGDFLDTSSIELDQFPSSDETEHNELKALKSSTAGEFCASGDRYGILKLLHGQWWNLECFAVKAHGSEINDIAITRLDDKTELVGSCGRDRTIQVYEKTCNGTVLMQTIEQHASSVNAILFIENGHTLCSASSDRTVVVHTMVTNEDIKAYLPTRILTTKQSPVSIALWPSQEPTLAVTTMDKQLHKFDVSSGQCLSSVRTLDDSGNSTVLLSSLSTKVVHSAAGPLSLLFAVSSTDKSVRVHDLESGTTTLRDYGHSEGLTSVAVLGEERTLDGDIRITLASTGLDGSVMLWELTNHVDKTSEAGSPIVETPSSQLPLRRVLSKSAIAEFSKTLEASGMTPLPPTPSRNPSPHRSLRKKLSKYSLTSNTSSKISNPPALRRPNQSPSPPSPATPVMSGSTGNTSRRPMMRVKSVGNFNELAYSADQLAKSLRTFRKKIATSSDALKVEQMKDLEKEISLTAKALGQNVRRRQPASEMNVGDLLDSYSDKLAQMVQEKMNISTIREKRKTSSTSSENTRP